MCCWWIRQSLVGSKSTQQPVKVLAQGGIDRPLTVKANRFSAAARAQIEAAGGKAEEVGHEPEAV